MIPQIIKNIFSGKSVITKDDIIKQMMMTEDGIITVLLPYIESLGEKVELVTNKSIDDMFVANLKRVGYRGNNAVEMLEDVRLTLEKANEITAKLTVIAGEHPVDTYTNRDIDPKLAYIVYASNTLTTFTISTPDIILDIMRSIFTDGNLPKVVYDNIDNIKFGYRQTVNFIKDFDINKIETKLNKINDRPFDELNEETLADREDFLSLNMPQSTNFVGNIIYHVRLHLLERDKEKYDKIKDKLLYLELMLDKQILKNQGKEDSKLNKVISNIRKDIVSYTKEMERLKG